jgi:gamma-glutamyltranspeptidase/glutathione hydrolase
MAVMKCGLFLLPLLLALPALAQFSMFPSVRGTREMVAAANNFEVEAGYRLLQQGGNAVDAGVAATLAAAVTEQARFGLGGEMPLMVKLAGKPVSVVAGVGTAPAKATVDYYRRRPARDFEDPARFPPIPEMGIESAILPGVADGLLLALREYGTKSFAEVAQPAIEYASGFPVGEEFAVFLRTTSRFINLWPSSRAFFFGQGRPEAGELYKLEPLAATLRAMAAAERRTSGPRTRKIDAVRDYFYRGEIARQIADFSAANGGLISREDLAGFRAELDQPVTGTYRGYTIVKPGFWTQGPVMIQVLNILEGFDLAAMGHNSPEYLHTVAEAIKLAFADRDMFYGDPKFAKIPAETLLSKEYAAKRRALIDRRRASMEHRPGDAGPLVPIQSTASQSFAQDTTCVNVVDRWGNVFNATPSGAWLPSVIAGATGIPLSSRLQSFVMADRHPNQLAPGKRPRVTLSPTMVLKDGKPFLVMSTPGGDNQDQAMLQVLLNILDFRMAAQDAAEAPRIQSEHFYASFAHHEFAAGKLNVESRFPKAVVEDLAGRGHRVNVQGPWSNGSAPTVIKIENGVLEGGADPRRGRFIFGR